MIYPNIIGLTSGASTGDFLSTTAAQTGEQLPARFPVATPAEIAQAMQLAQQAWLRYRQLSGATRADFLHAIADEIETLGDTLLHLAMQETGLPYARLQGERGRTCAQLRLFAKVAAEGTWLEAVIDHGDPQRSPAPKPDIRRMLVALGPVVVFTASNFPLAFSTAGGDTASALAAGCPVVVKAHEGHLGTHALVAAAIQRAALRTGMPDGVFSALQGRGYELGQQLVQHPLTKAVAFTGSLQGGKALYDLAQQRPEPIPVFAEMGSINPVFILPEALTQRGEAIAQQLAAAINLGAGQFCTQPGLIVVRQSAKTAAFLTYLKTAISQQPAAVMLHRNIHVHYNTQRQAALQAQGVELVYMAEQPDSAPVGCPTLATTTADHFLKNPALQNEVFGPYSLVVRCQDQTEMLKVAKALQGQLTACFMGEPTEWPAYSELIDCLQNRVGRLVFNGVPTGVEVGHAMHHGGPFPATTDSRFTSVGTNAIKRFARPVAWQDCPTSLLPMALQDENPLAIWRLIDGHWSKG